MVRRGIGTVGAVIAIVLIVLLGGLVTSASSFGVASSTPSTSPSDTPTTSPAPSKSAACTEFDRRGALPRPYGGAYARTSVRITKHDRDGVVYLDFRKEGGASELAVLYWEHGDNGYGRREIPAGDCYRFRGAQYGDWVIQAGVNDVDEFHWTYKKPSASTAPKLKFTAKHLSGKKFRLAWKGQRVSALRVQLVDTRKGRSTRTLFVSKKTTSKRVVKIRQSRFKRLRVTFVGPGGKETRRVALPRR